MSKLAFVFPGQGSQAVGMLDNWNNNNPEIVTTVCAEASAVLGYDMADLIANNPEDSRGVQEDQ